MVEDSIVIGNKISQKGIEVDRAKIEVIEKLPPPSSMKRVRYFLTLVEKTPPDAVKTGLSDAVLVRIRWTRSKCVTYSDAVQNHIRKA